MFWTLRQGHQMMTIDEISKTPNAGWMASSRKPSIHTWLQADMDPTTEQRLKVAGNVVIPKMAWVAANMLSHMAKWQPMEAPDFEYWFEKQYHT